MKVDRKWSCLSKTGNSNVGYFAHKIVCNSQPVVLKHEAVLNSNLYPASLQ